jgi:hypothetical protein
MDINKELSRIQQALKAPKGQWNSFSNFHYRSCEDILEAVKPLLGDSTLTLNDDVHVAGDRVYIKATATLQCGDKSISTSAFAREPLTKKGMDDSQITGSTSSYARKYALNGLFCIDDEKDADSMNNSQSKPAPKKQPQKKVDDDKPWFSEDDFELQIGAIQEAVRSGQHTPQSAVNFLRETYKVSRDMAESIKNRAAE